MGCWHYTVLLRDGHDCELVMVSLPMLDEEYAAEYAEQSFERRREVEQGHYIADVLAVEEHDERAWRHPL